MKFLTLDLSKKVDRLKLIILLMGFGVFTVVANIVAYQKTSTNDFCTSCHVMLPEYYTLKASSHKNVRCVDCHIEPGLENLAMQKLSGIKHAYVYFTRAYDLPIQMPLPMSNDACLRCHSLGREVSPSGDLIVPHQIHDEKRVSCIKCHSGVAHGRIASRRVTAKGGLSAWNEKKGQENMLVDYTKTTMDDCMKCHNRRNAPLECGACHSEPKVPKTHERNNFINTHGEDALANLDSCHLCHGYSGYASGEEKSFTRSLDKGLTEFLLLKPGKDRDPKEIIRYSRNNMFCVSCHSKKPQNHSSPSFINYHSSEGKKSKSACFTCHSNRPEELNPVTKTTCASCHPSSHSQRPTWREQHPVPVNGKINETCFSCHSKPKCTSCHYLLK